MATLKQKQAVEEAGVFHKKKAASLVCYFLFSFSRSPAAGASRRFFCTSVLLTIRVHIVVIPSFLSSRRATYAASNVITPRAMSSRPSTTRLSLPISAKKKQHLGRQRCYVVIFVLSHPRVEAKSRFFATLNCDKPKIQQKLVPKKKDALLVSATHAANRTARD